MAIVSPTTHDEEFDGLLADFFDWIDGRRAQGELSEASSRSRDTVEAFVAEHPVWRQRTELIDELSEFLHGAAPLEQLASQLTMDWIDGDSGGRRVWLQADAALAAEQLPRDFGDYQLLERVGQGGMGIVYRACQQRLGRTVCLKMLPPGLLEPQHMRRLANEARLAASLQHEGIVTVFDAGEFAGQPYIAMEFVAGETLAQRLARGPLESAEAVRLCDRVAAAVEHAHRHGVLHRDLKPANVLLEPSGRPRVADFGLARPIEQTHTTNAAAGTPSYMAPEQAAGGHVDERTDVYGLGAVFYQMLTGRPPHVGNTPLVTLRLVETEEPLPPARLRPGLTRDVDTICRKCLEKRPAARYQTVAALRDDLARLERHEPISARPIGALERTRRWIRRHAAAAAAMAISLASLLLLVIVGAVALVRTNDALEGTLAAEEEQRRLTGQLTAESKVAISALYRSQIARVGQSLDNGDLAAARQTLEDIARTKALASHRGLEYSLLMRRAYPEAARLDADLPATLAAAWFAEGAGFVTLGADGALRTWTAAARPIATSGAHQQTTLLAVSPTTGTIATADVRGVVRLWQKERLAPLTSADTRRTDPRRLAWHPDGRTLWMTDVGGTLWCIDAASTEVRDVPVSVTGVSDVAISSDGRWLVAVTQLRRLTVFDLPRLVEALDEQITGRATLSTSDRLAARLEPLAEFDMSGLVSTLSWSATAPRFAAADDSGAVAVWAVEPSSTGGPTAVREIWKSSAEGELTALAWTQGELLLADGRGWLTALDSQRLRTLWRQPAGLIREIIVSRAIDKWLAVEHGGNGVSLWDQARLNVGRPIVQGDVPVRSVALSPTGRHAAWRDIDGRITVFDTLDKSAIANLDEPALGATAIAWNPASDLLAIGRSGGVILFEPQAGATRQRLTMHQGTVWALACSPDGKLLASGAEDGTAIITNLSTGKSHALAGHQGEVRAVAFSHDGKTVATADAAAAVRLFDFAGRPQFRRDISAPSINALDFLPDRSLAIAQGSGRVSVMDTSTGDMRNTWQAHRGAVWSLTAAGDQLFSSGQDGVVALWDPEGNLELTLAHLRSPVWGLAWSAKANRLLGCTTAGAVHEWTSQ